MTTYSIVQLLHAIQKLSPETAETGRAKQGETYQSKWLKWLEEYDGPGFYGRSDWNVDAKSVYHRLNNGWMIAWLNEAAGEAPAAIRATLSEMREHGHGVRQTEAKIARKNHPWDQVARLLFRDE